MTWRAFLLALLLALTPSPLSAQSESEVEILNRAVMEHYQQGRYDAAAASAEQLLVLMEDALGPEHLELAPLLGNLATLYSLQGLYERAEPLYERALAIREAGLPPDHPDIANSLNNLAVHHQDQGQYDAAETLFDRALKIRERALGPDHLDVANSLNNLGALFYHQGRYDEAEPLYQRALVIRQAALDANDPLIANTLNNLANLSMDRGRYDEAERLFQNSLEIRKAALSPDHPDIANSLNNLAFLYDSMGRYGESERFYKDSLAINERALGSAHPLVAAGLNNLAALYAYLGRYDEAEPLYERALTLRENSFGSEHPATAQSLNNLALLYDSQGRYDEAEPLYRRALTIWESALGPEHPEVAHGLNNLAALFSVQGRFEEAEGHYRRSLAIRERAFGPDHPDVAMGLLNLAGFYQDQARHETAEPLLERALAVMETALGPKHANVARALNNLAALYRETGRDEAAEPLFRRALEIRESSLGPEHPDVAESLNNLALLHESRGAYGDAESLFRRALAIVEAAAGAHHPDVATGLNNLAALFDNQGRHAEAEPLYRRALAIRREAFGAEHRDVAISLNNLAALLREEGRLEEALSTIRHATSILARRAERTASRRGADVLAQARANRFAFLRQVRLAALSVEAVPERGDALIAESFAAGQRARASVAAQAVASMAARFAAGSDALAAVVRDRQTLAGRLQALETALIRAVSRESARRDAEGEAALRQDFAEVDSRLAAIDERLARDFPRYVEIANPAPLPLTEAQSLLGPDEALLSWLVAREETFLWVLRADRTTLFTLDLGEDALTAAVADLRSMLDPTGHFIERLSDVPAFDTSAAFALYRQLLAPAEPLLSDARHVFVVPDGALQSLPLGVLVTDAPNEPVATLSGYRDIPWLARRHAMTVLPSVSSLKALRTFAAKARASVPFRGIGNPRFEGNDETGGTRGLAMASLYRGTLADVEQLRQLAPLPDSETELRLLAETLGADEDALLLAEQASEARLRATDLSDARVVAFATHGLLAGDLDGVSEPALVLTPPAVATAEDDGLLTASEIARHLQLDADWVVLSACNTAAGDRPGAEGLSGLAKAFIYAGGRTLLVSHWPVASDAATRLTTRAFAFDVEDPTRGRAEAFRRSMLELIESPDAPHYAHPMFWAPFIVVGEGGAR